MKALVGAFNQEKALVGAFSVIVQPVVEPMELYTALSLSLAQNPVMALRLDLGLVLVLVSASPPCSWLPVLITLPPVLWRQAAVSVNPIPIITINPIPPPRSC